MGAALVLGEEVGERGDVAEEAELEEEDEDGDN